MGAFHESDRHFLHSVANLGYCNPFLTERVELERAVLGREFQSGGPVWSASVSDPAATRPNVPPITRKVEAAIGRLRQCLADAADVQPEELSDYAETVHYLLYHRYYPRFANPGKQPLYRDFLADWNRLCHVPGKRFESALPPAHLFACFRQIQRAFHAIYDRIIGNSMPAARLRASIWQSVFTHDMRRYHRTLYRKMGEFPTLITGPSGTGKELIARAIAGSRYVPFDPDRLEFLEPVAESFLPINLAALSPTLIESELFGHRRGAFTGAIGDRHGWLEACPEAGSVFLDELGEMEHAIQVKLLRVIETRCFSAVGDTAVREFHGKLIAATNRDLPREIRAGRFREDLYYRLCADLIRTPSLAEQLADAPEVMHELLLHMTKRTVGDEAERCLPEVETWIGQNLPVDYAWPGNYRELEQCVRNVVIRRSYRPLEASVTAEDDLVTAFRNGTLTAEELLARYAAQVYQLTGSYEEAARRMGLDRRTVKAKVEAFLQSGAPSLGLKS
ncbi:sigma 54-interacting transcriptional regulator [Paludibaculum fermentans]|uniref:Sigma-54-dependent Fis family transcriptional regulator n=1 Tax=Paludibaculum fermentans TaxID=1473598 RepID=A0A7S7SP66_PALFE|nr:sigma 54-interacting transcriptional regulator [Paludibaculum fermentans]QOY90835.1 sigma-54-dependent Fis family transcriptional regulator [Paludibaculum fermentans]